MIFTDYQQKFHGTQFLTETPINQSRIKIVIQISNIKSSTKHSFLVKHFYFYEMDRKKWTPKLEITDSVLKFREKRKWQLALRRYILEENTCASYAIYFGLSIEQFRKWIEIQFTEGLNWQNFGIAWQFDHIVPVAYFDFGNEEDLFLCWNFINIRVEKIELNERGANRIDIMAVRPYFQQLYNKTAFSFCLKMLSKIDRIEVSNITEEPAIEGFIIENKDHFSKTALLTKEEFNKLNTGISLEDILLEREIIRKYG
jgi:hypothetical protein